MFFSLLSLRSSASRSAVDFSSQFPPATGWRGAPGSDDDLALPEELEVRDPEHPLYGRRFRLISIETTACFDSLVRVSYRFGLTLQLPLRVTDLWPAGDKPGVRTKLSVDAVKDLIATAEGSEGACPSSLKRSGTVCRRRSAGRSPTTSPQFCGR
jgi:hypothetical protein